MRSFGVAMAAVAVNFAIAFRGGTPGTATLIDFRIALLVTAGVALGSVLPVSATREECRRPRERGVATTEKASLGGAALTCPPDEIGFGVRTNDAIDLLSVRNQNHCRNRQDTETLCQAGLINADLGEAHPRLELLRCTREGRRHCPARPTPLGPEIDQQRHIALFRVAGKARAIERQWRSLEKWLVHWLHLPPADSLAAGTRLIVSQCGQTI